MLLRKKLRSFEPREREPAKENGGHIRTVTTAKNNNKTAAALTLCEDENRGGFVVLFMINQKRKKREIPVKCINIKTVQHRRRDQSGVAHFLYSVTQTIPGTAVLRRSLSFR